MAKLLGAGNIHKDDDQHHNLEQVTDHKEETFVDTKEGYNDKLLRTIDQNNDFMANLDKVNKGEADIKEVEAALNETTQFVTHPYLNPKTSFYGYVGKEVIIEVDDKLLEEVEFDVQSLLKI